MLGSMKQSRLLNFLGERVHYTTGKTYSLSTWRKKVISRDNKKCQHCSDTVVDMFRSRRFSHEAHHIIPRKHGGRNTLNNGITLCKFCHMYFDHMYRKHGRVYYEILCGTAHRERIKEVNKLMRMMYLRHLLRVIRDYK